MPVWVDGLLRSLGLFLLVFAAIRILGKKHPVATSPFHFVVYSVVAVMTALLAVNIIPNFDFALAALATWVFLPLLLDYLALHSKALYQLLHGKETIIIKQGKVMEENLKQVRLSGEGLLKGLRAKNVFSVADVEFAVLETSGELSLLLKADKRPVAPHDLEWKVMPQLEPQTVILDGNILHDSLRRLGLTLQWLQTQLECSGVSLENVFLGQVNSAGELYVDLFDDLIQLPNPSVREMVFASLQQAQAELLKYSLSTEDPQSKKQFADDSTKVQQVVEKLRPHLLR
ncbi:MAG: DUF421 domain-containing protein [Dethiobacter sp.]|jgi:uncharacterized membrane protein YcaP (DUF421 family)|nr:DUF421 domain-containing protein [Dethiobacter sp.]MBS3898748.1 DUF421 domain-containing protein [Dethiobacter sp.]MBS3983582.1 DUF421 domain-containing protein [Dethiobacter sp.]MCL4463937.1 DUF421 domain-containing protein [Bacillota bacterium]MCL5993945.1 DUF421 domain-containing protein [Bacillota bacterium]